MTSAIWKAIERRWQMILAPILTSRSRNVVSYQCFTASGGARVLRKLARLDAAPWYPALLSIAVARHLCSKRRRSESRMFLYCSRE